MVIFTFHKMMENFLCIEYRHKYFLDFTNIFYKHEKYDYNINPIIITIKGAKLGKTDLTVSIGRWEELHRN